MEGADPARRVLFREMCCLCEAGGIYRHRIRVCCGQRAINAWIAADTAPAAGIASSATGAVLRLELYWYSLYEVVRGSGGCWTPKVRTLVFSFCRLHEAHALLSWANELLDRLRRMRRPLLVPQGVCPAPTCCHCPAYVREKM